MKGRKSGKKKGNGREDEEDEEYRGGGGSCRDIQEARFDCKTTAVLRPPSSSSSDYRLLLTMCLHGIRALAHSLTHLRKDDHDCRVLHLIGDTGVPSGGHSDCHVENVGWLGEHVMCRNP